MQTLQTDRDPVEVLAEEFVLRHRRGERPAIDEYVAQRPDLAEQIRRLFPAALMLERMRQSKTMSVTADLSQSALAVEAADHPKRLGDCRIVREVGRGGMGIVYEAWQESLGRQVALKVLMAPGGSKRASFRERFDREARAAARLHHTNIVPVYGVGEEDGCHYYVMQLIDGHGLDVILDSPQRENEGRTYWNTVGWIGQQVAEALQYAHESGVLHRDIKPSNLLLDSAGRVWVTDFGLAKLDDQPDITRESDILGTLRYMAPERVTGQCDARGDIYSLGLVLYELLTHRPAHPAKDRRELIEQITRQAPTPPRQINPRIPRDLETIVLKAMARAQKDRYPTAGEMAQDLRRFLEDKPITARPLGPAERLWRWSRRNPVVAGLCVALALVLVATAVVSLVAANRFRNLASDHAMARNDADVARGQVEATLAELYPNNALAASRRGEDLEAALWFANAAAISPKGSRQAERHAERAMLWSGLKRVRTLRIPIESASAATQFDRSERYVMVSGPCTNLGKIRATRVYDLSSGEAVGSEMRLAGMLRAADFSADSRHVVTVEGGSSKAEKNLLVVWDWQSGKRVIEGVTLPSQPLGVAYSTRGNRIAARCLGGEVVVVDAASGEVVKGWKAEVVAASTQWSVLGGGMSWSGDGASIVTWGSNSLEVWDVERQERRYPAMKHDALCTFVKLSSRGDLILSSGWDGTARVWRMESGEPAAPALSYNSMVYTARFAADDSHVIADCADHVVRRSDWRSGKLVEDHFDIPFTYSTDTSTDGRWTLCGVNPKSLRVAEAQTRLPAAPTIQLAGDPWLIHVAPSGKVAAITGMAAAIDLIWLDELDPQTPPDVGYVLSWCELASGQRLSGGTLIELSEPERLEREKKCRRDRAMLPVGAKTLP